MRPRILPYRLDTEAATSPIVVLNRAAGRCAGQFGPHDAVVGQSIRVLDVVTFQLLSIETDGTYRLRVSR